MNYKEVNDQTVMWYGAHKGTRVGKLPADYLIWLFDNNKCPPNLRAYIKANMDVLQIQVRRKKEDRYYNSR